MLVASSQHDFARANGASEMRQGTDPEALGTPRAVTISHDERA